MNMIIAKYDRNATQVMSLADLARRCDEWFTGYQAIAHRDQVNRESI